MVSKEILFTPDKMSIILSKKKKKTFYTFKIYHTKQFYV